MTIILSAAAVILIIVMCAYWDNLNNDIKKYETEETVIENIGDN